MWMRPSATAPNPSPPAGFEYCDGTPVTTVGSPLFGENKPSLMITSAGGAKGLVRGADVTASYGIGTPIVTGGSDTHTHAAVSSGFHNHSLSNHTHSLGAHVHAALPAGGSHDHGFTDTANTTGVPATGATFQGGLTYHNHAVPVGGAHTHGATNPPTPDATGTPSVSTTDGQGSHTHTINNNSGLPVRYAELAFIVRVL